MLKLDLHVHTKHSHDGFAQLSELINKAKQLRLDGFAITDHDTIIALREIPNSDLIIIPGIEISSSDGDILALGVQKRIRSGLNAERTIRLIHKMGGLAIAPHPFGKIFHRRSIGLLAAELPFDAIEGINARCYFANQAAFRIDKPKVGGSDAHTAAELGRAYTLIDAPRELGAILRAIKAGKTAVMGKSISPYCVLSYFLLRSSSLASEKLLALFGRKLHCKAQ